MDSLLDFYIDRTISNWIDLQDKKKFKIFDQIRSKIRKDKIKVDTILFWESLSEYLWNKDILKGDIDIDFWWWRTLGWLISDYLNYKKFHKKWSFCYIDFYCTWFEAWILNTIKRIRTDKTNSFREPTWEWFAAMKNILYNAYYDMPAKKLSNLERVNLTKISFKNKYKEIISEFFEENEYTVRNIY